MEDRRFTAPVDEIEGTIDSVSAGGVTLEEYPGLAVLLNNKTLARARGQARSPRTGLVGQGPVHQEPFLCAIVSGRLGELDSPSRSTLML
jgi:hypothetical protein